MRRSFSMLMLITLLCPMIALCETAAPELCGHWQTQEGTPQDRLTLVLQPDGSYHETRNEDDYGGGSWTLDGSMVSLSGSLYAPARNLTWDGACLIFDGQPMQRIIPEAEGQWVGFPGNDFSDVITLSVGKERFILHYTVFEGDEPDLPYGGYWFEGTYWLEGTWSSAESGLTLTTKQGDVFSLTQDPVTGFLTTQDGHQMFHYTD